MIFIKRYRRHQDPSVKDVYEILIRNPMTDAWSYAETQKLINAMKKFGSDYDKLCKILGRSYREVAARVYRY